MLTPTGVTYAQYWDAIKAGNPTHVRFTFLGQGIVLEDEDVLLSSGVNLTDMFNGDTDLVFGRTLSKQVTVVFINSSRLNGLQWTGEFTLEFGVEINGTTNWVTIGYFSGEKPKNVTSVQTIQFTAYDRMGRFDILADEFVKSLTYPKTVSQIYDALCTYVCIQNVAGDELANIKSRSFASAPAEMEGYTCRDLLAMIAEACGCYAKITAEGKVKLVWFTDNTAHAVTGTEEFSVESGDVNDGMTWDEADTFTWDEFDNFTWNDVCGYQEALRIDRLYVKQLSSDMDINYPYDYGDMVYSIVDNPFLSVASYADVTSYLKPIYDRLYNFGGYLPVSLECVGNWCVEAGDIITIDVNNLTITFPIFVKSMRWSGAINDAYETTGTTNRQVYSSEATKQRVMTSNKIEMYVTELEEEIDSNYYKIRSGIAITSAGVTISGSKYINIESGSKIDIKNGADLDIESGGDINIKSGGKASVESGGNLDDSGSINVKSGGKIDVKSGGDIDIESGGDVNVKSGGNVNVASGGNFNIASGGNMNVNATGTLNLTGATVSIKSGSTFDVQATNFSINSATQTLTAGTFWVNTSGFHYLKTGTGSGDVTVGTDPVFGTGTWYKFVSNTIGLLLSSLTSDTQVHGKKIRFTGLYTTTGDDSVFGEITMENDPDDDFTRLLFIPRYSGYYGGIGSSTYKWRQGYFYRVYYDYLTQNSSRDIKHNINPLESVGDKLDRLQPVTFVYDDDDEERQRMGLIYEDAVEVMPEICTNDESDKAINYVELIPALLKEIQELRIRVKTLEEREV